MTGAAVAAFGKRAAGTFHYIVHTTQDRDRRRVTRLVDGLENYW